MTPEVWGKHLWFSMHFIAMCYPSSPTYEQRVNYKKFYENVRNVLPCAKCAIHYRNNLELLPLEEGDKDYLENNKTLFEWTVKMHNIVNVSLGKPQVTLEEAENFYRPVTFQRIVNNSQINHRETKDTRCYLMWCIIGIIIGSLTVYLLKKNI